jgi:hypothetical protein
MTELIVTLIVALIFLVILAGVMAPFETLRWWGGWSNKELDDAAPKPELLPLADETAPEKRYVVYLSGIGSVSGDELVPVEVPFLEALQAAMPDAEVIVDVFPYSVSNNGLTGQRMMAGVFRWVSKRRWNKTSVTELLINIRNVFQVGVSADQRYGPVFNFATARVIRDKLVEHGYQIGSRDRVALIGYSGGGQISIGATPYLAALIDAPIRVISLGGVMTSDPGILETEHFFHVYSDIDELEKLGSIIFPSRWPIFTNSAWNTAIRNGKATLILQPGMTHTLAKSYMDPNTFQADGRSNMDTTVALIAELIRNDEGVRREPGSLSRAQLTDLVQRLSNANPAAAQNFVEILDDSGLVVQGSIARAALKQPGEVP